MLEKIPSVGEVWIVSGKLHIKWLFTLTVQTITKGNLKNK